MTSGNDPLLNSYKGFWSGKSQSNLSNPRTNMGRRRSRKKNDICSELLRKLCIQWTICIAGGRYKKLRFTSVYAVVWCWKCTYEYDMGASVSESEKFVPSYSRKGWRTFVAFMRSIPGMRIRSSRAIRNCWSPSSQGNNPASRFVCVCVFSHKVLSCVRRCEKLDENDISFLECTNRAREKEPESESVGETAQNKIN